MPYFIQKDGASGDDKAKQAVGTNRASGSSINSINSNSKKVDDRNSMTIRHHHHPPLLKPKHQSTTTTTTTAHGVKRKYTPSLQQQQDEQHQQHLNNGPVTTSRRGRYQRSTIVFVETNNGHLVGDQQEVYSVAEAQRATGMSRKIVKDLCDQGGGTFEVGCPIPDSSDDEEAAAANNNNNNNSTGSRTNRTYYVAYKHHVYGSGGGGENELLSKEDGNSNITKSKGGGDDESSAYVALLQQQQKWKRKQQKQQQQQQNQNPQPPPLPPIEDMKKKKKKKNKKRSKETPTTLFPSTTSTAASVTATNGSKKTLKTKKSPPDFAAAAAAAMAMAAAAAASKTTAKSPLELERFDVSTLLPLTATDKKQQLQQDQDLQHSHQVNIELICKLTGDVNVCFPHVEYAAQALKVERWIIHQACQSFGKTIAEHAKALAEKHLPFCQLRYVPKQKQSNIYEYGAHAQDFHSYDETHDERLERWAKSQASVGGATCPETYHHAPRTGQPEQDDQDDDEDGVVLDKQSPSSSLPKNRNYYGASKTKKKKAPEDISKASNLGIDSQQRQTVIHINDDGEATEETTKHAKPSETTMHAEPSEARTNEIISALQGAVIYPSEHLFKSKRNASDILMMCIACQSESCSIVFEPCHHCVLCRVCAVKWCPKACPKCSTPIERRVEPTSSSSTTRETSMFWVQMHSQLTATAAATATAASDGLL